MAGLIDLEPLFRPRSVAVVGASPRPSVGRYIIDTLKAFGFPGDIYPVNPGYAAIGDSPCFASLADLPGAGARAAVIFGGGYGEAGEWGRAAQAEISDIARASGIALCGPNCMGVISPHARSATYLHIGSRREELAGNVGLISQS